MERKGKEKKERERKEGRKKQGEKEGGKEKERERGSLRFKDHKLVVAYN